MAGEAVRMLYHYMQREEKRTWRVLLTIGTNKNRENAILGQYHEHIFLALKYTKD